MSAPTKRTSSRRRFLQGAALAGLAGWVDLESLLASEVTSEPKPAPDSTKEGILRLELQTPRLADMQRFYAETLGFSTSLGKGTLQVQAGGTLLHFEGLPDSSSAHYHLAWAIPSNKFELAKEWLSQRTPLLKTADGRSEFHFRNANRHAVYFADPAGNVLELIARHNLGDHRPGPFGLADLLYVNHAALVVDDLPRAVAQISRSLGLEATAPLTNNFVKLGDEHRHIVLVTRGRLWLPERTLGAEVFPTSMVLDGPIPRKLTFPDLPYRIEVG